MTQQAHEFETIHPGRPVTIRQATFTEMREIRYALRQRYHGDDYILDRAHYLVPSEVMVRTDFVSDGPGFAGKLAVIFWGEPQFLTVLGDNGSTNTNWEVIEPETDIPTGRT